MKTSQNKTDQSNLTAAIIRQFKPDRESVRKAYSLVENNRATFAVNALKFGLCALAARAVVGHGKFGAWLSAALASNGNPRPFAERTAKEYIGLARVYTDKLSTTDKLTGALESGVEDYCAIMSIPREQFSFEAVLASPADTDNLLNATVRGMTLTQMRQLLREGAERAYADEQADQQTPQPKSSLRGLQGGNAGGGQMTFFNELFEEVRATVEIKRENDPRFLQLSKEEMGDLGNYLIEQGKAILNLAKEKRD